MNLKIFESMTKHRRCLKLTWVDKDEWYQHGSHLDVLNRLWEHPLSSKKNTCCQGEYETIRIFILVGIKFRNGSNFEKGQKGSKRDQRLSLYTWAIQSSSQCFVQTFHKVHKLKRMLEEWNLENITTELFAHAQQTTADRKCPSC
jgi:hypothetical protein